MLAYSGINPPQNWSDMQRAALESSREMDTSGVLCLTRPIAQVFWRIVQNISPGARSRLPGRQDAAPHLYLGGDRANIYVVLIARTMRYPKVSGG